MLLHEHPDHLSHSGMLNLTSFRKFIFISDQTLGLESSFLNWTKIYHPWSCHLVVWLGTGIFYKTYLFYMTNHRLFSDLPWVLFQSSPRYRSLASSGVSPVGFEVSCYHLGCFSQHRGVFFLCVYLSI